MDSSSNETNPVWVGTATEITEKIKTDIPVNAITRKLNVNTSRLFNEHGFPNRQL